MRAEILSGYLGLSDVAKLGECEFYLISEMNSQMIVHHPYRALNELKDPLNLDQADVSLAWSVINDHYLTDLPLLYAPHIIAVTAIFLAVALKPNQPGIQSAANTISMMSSLALPNKDLGTAGTSAANPQQKKVQHFVSWLAKSEIDLKAVTECSQEIISLYECLAEYRETTLQEQIARFVRAKGPDK